MAVDATIGGTDSDSYITVADADAYHDSHLYATTWDNALTSNKEKALKMATRLLDERITWVGDKHTSTQSLRWPRSNVVDKDGYTVLTTEIPKAISNATAEFARHLLGSDLTSASEGKGLDSVKADKVSVKFSPSDRLDVLPEIVLEMLAGWGSVITRGGFGVAKIVR